MEVFIDPSRQAEELVSRHGHKAMQAVIDQIVVAVKAGRDEAVRELDLVLRAVERILNK